MSPPPTESAPKAPSPATTAALDRSFAGSIAWTATIRWSSQLLTWLATLLVARILRPDDYGLVGMATVYFGLVTMISEFGLGASIVVLRELSREQIARLNGLAVLIGVGCFTVSWGVATPIARFFEVTELANVVLVMSATFAITGFRSIPFALLEKDLRFKRLALIHGAAAIVTAASTLLFALLGFGYWALVAAYLVNAAVSTALALFSRPHPLAWPRLKVIRDATAVGFHVIVGRVAWYVYSNADYLIAGKLLGKTALGFYSLAFMLASVAVDRITALVSRVTPAHFSVVQREPASLRRYVLGLTEGLAMITFPATFGLALVADDFVLGVLGAKWEGAIMPLQLLALYSSFRSITPLLSPVLLVTGRTRFLMWHGVVTAIVLTTGFAVGSRWGAVGIAAAWTVVHPLAMLPVFWLVFRSTGLTSLVYMRSVWPALSGSLVMAVAVLGLGQLLPEGWSHGAQLSVQVLAGALCYPSAMLVLHRSRLRAAYRTFKRLRAGA